MTKSELIEKIAEKQSALTVKEIDQVVKCLLEQMSQTLATGGRIEVRGFGCFSLHHYPARMGRNPKTGEAVARTAKYFPHFKPSVLLRQRVNCKKS